MRRAAFLVAVLLAACGDNQRPPSGEVEADAAPVEIDAGIDGAPSTLGACLDRPTDLPRPPTGQLPCELIPPGLVLQL
jgi:hypothetical protein